MSVNKGGERRVRRTVENGGLRLFRIWKEGKYWLAKDMRTGQLAQGRSIAEAKRNSIVLSKLVEQTKAMEKV